MRALRSLNLMNTEPEERFDRLCRLATHLLGAPIAYVSLLDDESQFFKSAVGLGDLRETSRKDSFCTHAIEAEQALYVPDASSDERFKHNPYVQGAPGVRCYLGEPLFSSDGYPVGTFCILDLQPRVLDPEQRQLFRDLAALAERELNLLARLHQQRKLTELTSELVNTLDQDKISETLLRTLRESLTLDRAAVILEDGCSEANMALSESLAEWRLAGSGKMVLEVPIRFQQKEYGLLCLERQEQSPFTELERELVESFVVQTGLILENRSILAKLFEQSKSATIGSLAAGIAHEINSPLGAARLGIEACLRSLEGENPRLQRKLEIAKRAIAQAGEIIDNVLRFSGEGPRRAEGVRLEEAVEQGLAFFKQALKAAEVEVEVVFHSPTTGAVSQDDFQTILHHLLRNALWAVRQGGAEEKKIVITTGHTDQGTYLQVTDFGPGVADSVKSRIFEPFFTTKEPGRGVGLGLWASRRLAEQAGGYLELVGSRAGASFRLTLPAEESARP